jgi:hypothetical protein
MEAVPVKFVPRGFGETYRRDWWWVEPMIVFTVFGSFIVYATWAAFQNAHYTYGPYLSPFYSPELWGDSPHAVFGPEARMVAAAGAVFTGAADSAVPRPLQIHLLLLPRGLLQSVLGGSDFVYGRRAAKHLLGRKDVPAHPAERHRYLPISRASSCWCSPTTSGWRCGSQSATGQTDSGIGVGTLILAVNVVLPQQLHAGLSLHSHVVGGVKDEVSKSSVRPRLLQLLERPQRPAHALCLDESVLSRALRSLRAVVLDGHPD